MLYYIDKFYHFGNKKILMDTTSKSAPDHSITDKRFITHLQLELLQRAIAPWPRRKSPLLVINCGAGAFLQTLWQSGFDLVATENDSASRKQAAALNIPDLEILAATEDDLPFEDETFDWTIYHVRKAQMVSQGLHEALRVAKRGIMLTFWNKASLAAMGSKILHANKFSHDEAIWWWQISKKLKALQTGSLTVLSTLTGPVFTWSFRLPFTKANAWSCGLPVGAWCIARLTMGGAYPLTPMPLKTKAASPQPALEYVHKKIISSKQ